MNPERNLIKNLEHFLTKHSMNQAEEGLVFEERLGDVKFELEVADYGKHSFSLKRIEARISEDQGRSIDDLRKIAQKLAAQLTYLLEDLQIIEEDVTTNRIQLRSVQPAEAGEAIAYFEVIVDGHNHISLKRFEQQPKEKTRTQVPFTLTTETLQKLVRDIVRLAPTAD